MPVKTVSIPETNIDVPAFEKFLTLKNLSGAKVTNHLRALNTFLKYKKPVQDLPVKKTDDERF